MYYLNFCPYSYNLHYEKVANEVKCIEDEIPFDIPDSWRWCRLGNISTYSSTKKKIKAEIANKDLWELNLEDIEKGGKLLLKKTVKECNSKGDKTIFYKNDILYSKLRPYLLKVLIADDNGICTPEIVPFKLYGSIEANYIVNVLKSPYIDSYINSVTYGVKMPRAGTETMVSLLIPLPPIEEQMRIIKAIQTTYPLIEKYNIVEEELHLLNSTYKEQQKITILQYAIEGKLVEQDPSDDSASILLDKIKEEKEKLIKEGKIKRDKNESFIFKRDNSYYENINGKEHCIDDEIPFNIPDSWRWCRLNTITLISMGSSPKGETLNQNNDGIEFHQGKTLFSDKYLNTNNVFTNKPTIIADVDSVLMCVRAPVGKVNITKRKICIGRGLSSIKGLSAIDSEYLFYFLLTYEKYLCSISTGSTFKAINSNQVKQILFPLAPLQEQKRIVEQIHIIFDLL